jgi:hypothetical protein
MSYTGHRQSLRRWIHEPSLAYLVPVLLHTSFSALRECLRGIMNQQPRSRIVFANENKFWDFSTLAISLQVFPVSLICFNLSSSAGVQGVFVRLFLSFGSGAEASTSAT